MRKELSITQIREFLENGILTTDFAETQQVVDIPRRIVFLKFLPESVPLEVEFEPTLIVYADNEYFHQFSPSK